MANPPFNPDETKPADSDLVSNHPANERTTRDVFESWLLVDHNNDPGGHDKVTLAVQSPAPTAGADEGIAYTKDVSSKAELHFADEDGNEIQITSGGSIPQSSLALANDLSALEALSGTGLAKRTGADTWSLISEGSGGGLNADQVDGVEASALAQLAQNETVSGSWTFSKPITLNAATPNVRFEESDTTDENIYLVLSAGTLAFQERKDDGALTQTLMSLHTAGGLEMKNATGGDQGVGTINADGLYVNGNRVFTTNDGDLNALEGLSGTGIAKRTGANTWALVSEGSLGGIGNEQVFTSNGTWSRPSDTDFVHVTVVGGGGGGGSGGESGGSGGGGGAAVSGWVKVTGNVSVTAGAGGSGGLAGQGSGGDDGGNGGNSSFSGLSAPGGTGGTGSSTGAVGTGGSISASNVNRDVISFDDGYDGVAATVGDPGTDGGDSAFHMGAGGAAGAEQGGGGNGTNGSGGGGGHGNGNKAGGDGGTGLVIVRW